MKLTTSFKVACGYIILTSLLLGTIYYIYMQTASITKVSATEQTSIQRRKTIHKLVSQLFETENIGQTVRMGHWEAYRIYEQSLENVQKTITTLDSLITDSVQKERLDTLSFLLENKKKNIRQLLIAVNNDEPNRLYHEQISKIIESKDSIAQTPHIARNIIHQEETQTVKKEKKKFFQRLAEAFHPQKKDSTEVRRSSTQIQTTDTLMQEFNAGDTLAQILDNIEKGVKQSSIQRKKRINTQTEKLKYVSIELNAQVTDLLESIENEEQLRIQEETEKERKNKRQAAITTATIAIAAILLAILFFIIVWRDLTRSTHLRKELEKAKKKAEDLLAAREQLMLTVTHDIKAPASAITGYADLLKPYIKSGKPANYLNNIRTSSTHLLHLVMSLLDYHKLESHRVEQQIISFNPSELLHATIDSFRPEARLKQLQLICTATPETNRIYSGDALRIRQIIENLTGNALKFTKKGEIRVNAKMQSHILHLDIQDSGCGMTEDEQHIIFKAFTRLKSAQGEEGVGLGLSITYQLIKLLQGTIRIESTPGKGTTFHVSLPLQTPHGEPNETKKDFLSPLPHPLRMMIVDDDRIQLQLTQTMLEQLLPEKHPHHILCCSSPEEVFQHLSGQTVDILFTDIQMPAMNGFELLSQIQQIPQWIARPFPVIAVTARQDMDETYVRQHGFLTTLHKPFNRNDLAEALRKAFGKQMATSLPTLSAQTDTAASPSIDLTSLTVFAGDDRKAAAEILNTFHKETEQHALAMQRAYTRHDKAEVCRLAHKLLPTFTLIGAPCTDALRTMDARKEETEWNDRDNLPTQEILDTMQEVLAALKDQLQE